MASSSPRRTHRRPSPAPDCRRPAGLAPYVRRRPVGRRLAGVISHCRENRRDTHESSRVGRTGRGDTPTRRFKARPVAIVVFQADQKSIRRIVDAAQLSWPQWTCCRLLADPVSQGRPGIALACTACHPPAMVRGRTGIATTSDRPHDHFVRSPPDPANRRRRLPVRPALASLAQAAKGGVLVLGTTQPPATSMPRCKAVWSR